MVFISGEVECAANSIDPRGRPREYGLTIGSRTMRRILTARGSQRSWAIQPFRNLFDICTEHLDGIWQRELTNQSSAKATRQTMVDARRRRLGTGINSIQSVGETAKLRYARS